MVFQLPWKSSGDSVKPAEESTLSPASASGSPDLRREVEQHGVEKSTRRSDPIAFLYSLESTIPHVELLTAPYVAVAFITGIAAGACGVFMWNRWLRRIRTAEWVTPDIITRRRWVKGIVTSVGDADNFRLYHTPGIGWRWFRRVPSSAKDLKDQTIHIRIAGVDAPECGHFGRPAQPHAEESLSWLKNRLEGRSVYCQLVRKDQYGRVVAVPVVPRRFLPSFLGKRWASPLALEMLRAGTVTTYEQAGAEYGPWSREAFLRVEAKARAARRGMWKSGGGGETPAEYKRRLLDLASRT
ncbi:SNase-domain-containing protein [Pisolithus tinctorius]|nr:SNase-domain-containing protein [Pisolithus tinctorius]